MEQKVPTGDEVPLCGKTFKFDETSGQCVTKEVPVIPAVPAKPASCPSGYVMSPEKNRCTSSGDPPNPDCSSYDDKSTGFRLK